MRALVVELEHAAQHEGLAGVERASGPGLQHELTQLIEGERAHPPSRKDCGYGVQEPTGRAPEGVMDGVDSGGGLRGNPRRGAACN